MSNITSASPSFEKLKFKLHELFELDKADLDFGIYRIMNVKRDELKALHEQADDVTKPGEQAAQDAAKRGRPKPNSMPPGLPGAESGAVGGVGAATFAGFSANAEGIGIGPQLDAAMKTAQATQQTADATQAMVAKFDGIDAAVQAATNVAKGQEARLAVDRDLVSSSQQMLSELVTLNRGLKDLTKKVAAGGLAFS